MNTCGKQHAIRESQGISLTLGTAGHIDHGKTSIVKCLTGCWCDKLPEEQARGMTIDLGFAVWERGEGRRVGVVDVPGHERFIHNMVAGASGIDVVMLVVAADDGVMPQTIEHVQIVKMLGVKRGVIVMNKVDLADAEQRAQVEAEIRDCVAGTFLESAPIVPFSAKTGEGLVTLLEQLGRVVDATVERDSSGPFLVHVERAFNLKGLGAIVSGIPRSGSIRVGDELELLPDGTRHVVKGLQVYGATTAVGRAGECVALRLSNLSMEMISRGKVLAAPGYFTASRFLNVKFTYLAHYEKPLALRTAIRFHVGTSETPGHIVLPERERLVPGSETYAQIQLSRPVVAAPGDFYVLRQLSPVQTLGGGTVIDLSETKLRRGRDNWTEARMEKERALDDEAHALLLALQSAGATPCHIDNWVRQASVVREAARGRIEMLVAQKQVISLPGDRYVTMAAFEGVCGLLVERLTTLHAQHPLYRGFEKKDILKSMTGARLLMDRAFETLIQAGQLVQEAERFYLRVHEPRLTEAQQRLAQAIEARYHAAAFVTPRTDELGPLVGADQALIDALIVHLQHCGKLVELADQVILHTARLEEARAVLLRHFEQHRRLRLAEYKDLLNSSRKFAVPLLEYWDRIGVTRRVGDERELRA